jgi:PAS domain S-box-containing protein
MIPFRRERGLAWVFALYLALCVALPVACWGLGASAAVLYLVLAGAGLIALGLLAILSQRHRPDAAELELRKRKAVLDAMASMAHVGAWEVDADTRLSEWSEEVFRIHELEPNGPISSATVLSFYHPDVRPTVEAAVKETMRDGKPFDLTLPLTTARGNPRWVRNLGRAVYEGGRITGMRGAIQDVTASYEMQQRLARLSRASAEGHWEYDFVRRIAWLSASFRQLLGEEAREHLCSREQFLDVLVPEDRQRLETELVERTQAGVPYDIELRVRRRDGSLRWVRSRAAMEFDAAGRPLRIGGSIIDIENERAARLELEALRARHDRALRGTHDGVWDWSLVNDECWMSPQFRVLLGYAADDLETVPNTAAGFLALVHPEDDERIRTATRRHLEEDQKYDVEYRLRCRDGRYRWFRSRGSAEYNAAGIPVAFSGSVQDIDDQKAAEFESAEAKRRLARAIDGSSDAFFEAEPAGGGPSWYSPRLREMLEYGPLDPFPDSLLSLLAPADVEAIRMASRHPRDDGLPYEVVVPAPTRRGNTRWLRLRWRAEQDATDGRRRFAGSIQDITVQREAEAALRAATEAAAAANRAKSEFLANMSHEIRTPLNGVLGMTELLLDGRLEPEQRSSAETIRASGAALLKIVNDILDLSKIDAGKLTLEQLPMQVAESVRRATGLLLPQALKRGLALRTAIDPEVPARVVGDPLRLEQILLNLAGNAMKFTHQGEVAIHVRLAERNDPSAVLQFEVSDTGIGMDAATLERLFAPFTQADATTTRHYGGTGLGLSIVKRLLDQLGGRIEVESEVGNGTRFRFTWPCEVLGAEPDASQAAPEELVDAPVACVQGRVLVVEDHPVNQLVARRQLERLGCSVVLAENGAIGVSLARSEPFDLILMDVQMPILDGLAATREIRATEPAGKRIPIIAATASAMTDELERCREAGMDDLLTKPLSRPHLQALLLRYLPVAKARVIDEERVQALLAEDREFAATLTATFVESTREMLAEIDAATTRLDRPALATLAHRLRGAATSAGGAELSLIASRLEKQAASAAPAELGAFGAELHQAYAATVRSLESLGLGRHVA